MQLDADILKQLHDSFRVEFDDQLQVITDRLLELEQEADAHARQDALHAAFRAAHNIKGAARAVNLERIAAIAHRLESLFNVLKTQSTAPPGEIVDLCLETLDAMREVLKAHDAGAQASLDETSLFQRLDYWASSPPGPTATPDSGTTSAEPPDPPPPAHPGEDMQASTIPSELLAASADADQPRPAAEPEPARPVRRAQGATDTIKVTTQKLDGVGALAEELQVAKIALDDHCTSVLGLMRRVEALHSLWSRSAMHILRDAGDSLPDSVWQLLQGSKQAIDGINRAAADTAKTLRGTTNRVGFISKALHSDVRLLRLVPAATVLRPLSRTVRDISRQLGKQVALEIYGDDTEVDRAVLDGLHDPLLHLIRNAIDHGIETPAERRAAGKPDEGCIVIDVRHEGSQLWIDVRDDGRGIEAVKMACAAVWKSLISAREAETMSEQSMLDLIFMPGFSSKGNVTDVSGRGVGLDVVRNNVRELKGTVSVDTTTGRGTVFKLRMPLTLTTERGLHVRTCGEQFVMPSTAVDRILDVRADDIVHVEARPVILLDGLAVPVHDLGDTLKLASPERTWPTKMSVVMVSSGHQSVAFVVDEVVGEREIVIKNLVPPLVAVRHATGATLTGDGAIMLVLNSAELVGSALNGAGLVRRMAGSEQVQQSPPCILVVDDSITTRMLERNILEAHGYRVAVATNGQQGWEMLRQQRFDLVVTDIEMPVMDGFTLTEHIKQSEDHASIPVVVVSSLSSKTEQRRGMQVGADAYIVKGDFETRILLDAVQQWL